MSVIPGRFSISGHVFAFSSDGRSLQVYVVRVTLSPPNMRNAI